MTPFNKLIILLIENCFAAMAYCSLIVKQAWLESGCHIKKGIKIRLQSGSTFSLVRVSMSKPIDIKFLLKYVHPIMFAVIRHEVKNIH